MSFKFIHLKETTFSVTVSLSLTFVKKYSILIILCKLFSLKKKKPIQDSAMIQIWKKEEYIITKNRNPSKLQATFSKGRGKGFTKKLVITVDSTMQGSPYIII